MLVTSWPGEAERSRALGTYGAVVSAGLASGAVLGGLLAEATWRLVFFVNVPIGTGLLATWVVPSGPPHPHMPQPNHLFRHHAGGIP